MRRTIKDMGLCMWGGYFEKRLDDLSAYYKLDSIWGYEYNGWLLVLNVGKKKKYVPLYHDCNRDIFGKAYNALNDHYQNEVSFRLYAPAGMSAQEARESIGY